MEKTERFYDFCVPYNEDFKEMRATLSELVELGYKTIAIEQLFDYSKKSNFKRGTDIFPQPCDLTSYNKEFGNKLKILNRLTIIYCDADLTHPMSNSLIIKKYNIIAGLPKSDAALNHCCTTFTGEILTYDPAVNPKLVLNKKSCQIAVNRGLFFELKYSAAVTDKKNRKDLIRMAHSFCVRGKTKNVIFSSGATNSFELRGPYDVANLSFIFGLSEDEGKKAIDRNCRSLFLKAESRRIGKTIMFVKCSGPIVFSDSSDEDVQEENDEKATDDESEEQPHKKQKTA